ncbi:MAG: alanine racemase [Clostridiales bacterium]|jgi:alanine racemase|nr:alanine racemase [Clostridiales bacterium]
MESGKRAWREIDLDAIESNAALAREIARPPVKLMAVVKADAYGHGAVEASKACIAGGADWLGVALCEEGLALRKEGITAPILVLGFTPEPIMEEAVASGLSLAIYSAEGANALSRAAAKLGKAARVHIKADTGMSRLGFLPESGAMDEICRIALLPGLVMEGLFTHLAKSDSIDLSYAKEQIEKFAWLRDGLKAKGLSFPLCHAANSGGILAGEEYHLDMVRAGIILYGLDPSSEVKASRQGFKPAMSVRAHASLVKRIAKGTSVSYGRKFIAPMDMDIATVPVGYADGYCRRMSKGGRVLVGGQYAPVVGTVCMDQFMVDASAVPGIKAGSVVTLMGRQGGRVISAEDLAQVADTIGYEIVCGFNTRMPRVFTRGSKALP